MKVDRFVKVLLGIIALLLAANYFSGTRLLTEEVVYANNTASFMHVGQVYCKSSDFSACKSTVQTPFKFLKAGTNGWIYVEDEGYTPYKYWMNINVVGALVEKPQ